MSASLRINCAECPLLFGSPGKSAHFRDVRSHAVELKRRPSDPGRISPIVRSSGNYFLRTDIRKGKEVHRISWAEFGRDVMLCSVACVSWCSGEQSRRKLIKQKTLTVGSLEPWRRHKRRQGKENIHKGDGSEDGRLAGSCNWCWRTQRTTALVLETNHGWNVHETTVEKDTRPIYTRNCIKQNAKTTLMRTSTWVMTLVQW